MHLKAACAAMLAIVAVVCTGGAVAQSYPSKPPRLIVTYPPGGSSDLMGRVLGQKLSELWGQQVIIESKPGAAGSIGMEFAARQPADGYAFVIGNFGPVAINPLLSKLPYDIQKDFLPVSMLCTGPNILVVNSATPVNNVQELVTLAQKDAGKLNFGTSGPGSMSHLVGEMFKRQAQINIVQVPYKGGVLAVQDLMAGQVQLIFSDALPVMQHIRAGKLRPLGITSKERSPLSPEIPTMAEQGFPELVAVNWWGVLVPAGTPRPIIEKLNADLAKVLANADLKEKYAQLGVEPVSSTPEFFGEFIRIEAARYARLIKDANIKVE
ncbi:MAG TPA: tripartite tricarboxylate transporter substrate binding protein [Burkholderiales bacterium]|nr:tripartite tricarboxylate transporter substrate binding protein [Burkholderiales bacterium]